VRELVNRGDDIVYYSAETFAAPVERAGAQYRPYRNAHLLDLTLGPLDQLGWRLMRTTAEVLDAELGSFRSERADYLVTDSVAPWGQWLAQILRLPVVTSISTFAFNRHVLAFGLAQGVRPKGFRTVLSKVRHTMKAIRLMRQLQRRYGVSGPGIAGTLMGHSDLNIVYTSRLFQPCADTFDDRFQFVGPSLGDRGEVEGFPWDRVRQPVVYVSLGTLFNVDATFYRNCFEAFRDDDLQVIMSIGAHVSRDSLGVTPPNCIVQAHVPQLDVLSRASAFVTHGGMNSVSESLFHGVPMVVVAQMSEQEIIGRRVAQLGAGLYLPREDATAEKLRTSVRHLLTDSRFREQAALVQQSFRTAGGVARAADAIQTFTRQRAS
ncbi:MAG: hypothetical protein LC753_05835, partial [Acidobacteria bacterium]|nr:hypothetical protein [Acidobacteriota bacterium]